VNEKQVKKRNTESYALAVTLDVLISLMEVSKAPLLRSHGTESDIHDSAGTMCMGAQSTMHPIPQCYYLQTTVWRECQSHGSTIRTNKTYLYLEQTC
jgi:hypothetical protein